MSEEELAEMLAALPDYNELERAELDALPDPEEAEVYAAALADYERSRERPL